ncbi:DNA-processing protein DprA [Anaerolineales bacterium]
MLSAEWIALSLVPRVGGKTFKNLLTHFDQDLTAILRATTTQLRQVSGIGEKTAAEIAAINLAQIHASIPTWQAAGIQILTWDNPQYPAALKQIDDAPPTLFALGNLQLLDHQNLVALVGSRQPSYLARQTTLKLAESLVSDGYGLVSGMAMGIDTAAHQGFFCHFEDESLNLVPNIAVLGSGVLNCYPYQSQSLYRMLKTQGLILSETHPTATASAARLVARNRLITALCKALVIIETQIDGGAMHAYRFATYQQREIYVMDLPASGNQEIIKNGINPLALDLHNYPFHRSILE